MSAKACVFIHTNPKQMMGALVSQYSLKRNSKNPDAFDVRIISTEEFPFLARKEGQPFLRNGGSRVWHMEDLQSFTPLRFTPPELMGYEGRAVVIDPDIFAVGDINELLNRDMQGKAIFCRSRSGKRPSESECMATSVMLLDCAKLRHWKAEEQFQQLFDYELDYADWICLHKEDREMIGIFENSWNDLDHLDENTKLLHNTKRQTQPWKTGLPVDFISANRRFRFWKPKSWLQSLRTRVFGLSPYHGRYRRHPDPKQEAVFFTLLAECFDKGIVTKARLEEEMASNHIRHDALEMIAHYRPAVTSAS